MINTCTYPECNRDCVGRGLCTRHYAQERRGRLGKTKAISPPGQGAEVTVRCPKSLKAAMVMEAAIQDRDTSELWRDAAVEYLSRIEG